MQVSALAPPRHQCSGCGACCQGAVIYLMDGEAEVLEEQAAQLGLENPVDGETMRMHKGACTFLQSDGLCAIHATFGEPAKPSICKQFPFVLVETETGVRMGIDPASVAWHTSREDAPMLNPATVFTPRPCHLSPEQAAVERHLVAVCSQPGATLAGVIAVLCGAQTDGTDLPPGYADRWLAIAKHAPLALLLGHKTIGPLHREALLPVVTELPETPPAWPCLSPELDAEAVALIRDALYLRVVTKIPLVQASALLIASGAVLCAWHNPEPAAFRRSLSLWCRILRAGSFWQSLVPDPARLQWLATGEGPDPF